MGEVIEASTHAYDSRDDAQTKMLALKEKADKELAQYTMELKVSVPSSLLLPREVHKGNDLAIELACYRACLLDGS